MLEARTIDTPSPDGVSQLQAGGSDYHQPGAQPASLPRPAMSTETQSPPVTSLRSGQVKMCTNENCALAVTIYPQFSYDARGGGGTARANPEPGSQRLQLTFDTETLNIPDVSYRTARFLGVPLLPLFHIAIQPLSLQGWIDRSSGEVELQFEAKFNFTVNLLGRTLYAAPPLLVTTTLTTAAAKGEQLGGQGTPLQQDGSATLAGVSLVPKTGDLLFDQFLRLPGETLATMSAQFEFGPA